jgi:hypothetical protein
MYLVFTDSLVVVYTVKVKYYKIQILPCVHAPSFFCYGRLLHAVVSLSDCDCV